MRMWVMNIALASLCLLIWPFSSKAAGVLILSSDNNPTGNITCGGSYTVSMPNYSGSIWLNVIKNGFLTISGTYTLPIQPFPSVCGRDEGNYEILVFKLNSDGSAGDMIGRTTLSINSQMPPPRLLLKNLNNSERILQIYTEDYVRLEIKSKNYNMPVRLCKTHQQNITCSFISSYTNRDTGEWQLTQQILPLTDLGDWEVWVVINNQESNHITYTVLPKPKEPSYLVTCFLVQERPHPDVWPGDKVTWTILSRPYGYKIFWYETSNNRLSITGLPVGHSTNVQIPEVFTSVKEGVYERWAQLRNKDGAFVCNTNVISFVVTKQISANSPSTNSFFGLLFNFLKFDKIRLF